jgi:hypothetical protein
LRHQKIYQQSVEVWRQWTPRRLEEDFPTKEQVPIRVLFDEFREAEDWILRKNLEWEDFRFLVNAKLGHDQWEARNYCTLGYGCLVDGVNVKPRKGQTIRVTRARKNSACKKWAETRRKFGIQVMDHFQELEDWLPEREFKSLLDEENPTVHIDYSDNGEKLILQLPGGHECAFFESFMNLQWTEGRWIACFYADSRITLWENAVVTPRPGQRIRIFWTDTPIAKQRETDRRKRKTAQRLQEDEEWLERQEDDVVPEGSVIRLSPEKLAEIRARVTNMMRWTEEAIEEEDSESQEKGKDDEIPEIQRHPPFEKMEPEHCGSR